MSPPRARSTLLRRAGLACVLIATCSRVVTTTDPLPGWSLDPLTTIAPNNGVGPALSLALAALAFLGLAFVLAAAWRARERTPTVLLTLAALGLIPITYHGWFGPTACVENANTGLTWAAAMAGAIGGCIACRHRPERALVIACCAALAGPLAVRAAVQVYSEHPILVADFEANRDAFLASHGWTPGSAMARSFERRLSQPDASAWFAMSNVYASVMAGCVAIFAAACVAGFRARLWTTGNRNDLYRAAAVVAGLACALGGLFIALPAGGSIPKGAAAAMLLGLALLTLAVWCTRGKLRAEDLTIKGAGFPARGMGLVSQWGPAILGPALVSMALAAVFLRGLLGEQLGELSLLFRFYYLQAATQIFIDNPLRGVGPDGFQSAYLIAKNPLNPEEVSSPHSVFFDYASTLGLFALAWCGLLCALIIRTGRNLLAARSASEGTPSTLSIRWLFAVIVPCCLISFLTESLPIAQAVPDAFALLLFDGLTKLLTWALLWVGLAAALLTFTESPLLRFGLAAAALAVLTHAQIELTGTDLSSCGWALLLLGAGSASSQLSGPALRRSRLAQPIATIVTALLAFATLLAAVPVRAWEAELNGTAALVAESTAFIQRANDLATNPPDDSSRALGSDLAAALGQDILATPQSIADALNELRLTRVSEAAERLDQLARSPMAPSRAVTHTAIRLRGVHAALSAQLDRDPSPELAAAINLATWSTTRWPAESRALRDLAQTLLQSDALAPDAGLAEPYADINPLLKAADLDPFSPQLAHKLALRFVEAQNPALASHWAARALESHDHRHLDPLGGLSDSQRQDLRELLGIP